MTLNSMSRSRSWRRILRRSATESPRWSETIAVSTAERTSTSSATWACLASVGIVPPFLAGAACAVDPCCVSRAGVRALIAQRRWTEVRPTLPRRARRRPPLVAGPSAISVRSVRPHRARRRGARQGASDATLSLAERSSVAVGPDGATSRTRRGPCRQAAALARRPGTSTRMPGPMVAATVRLLKYWPLASLGRARLTASVSAARLSSSCSGSKLARAERDVDDTALVDLELHAATLDLADGARQVERDRARLGVRHEPAPAEDAAELADLAHHVGGRERDVELEPARLDALDEVVAADLVGAGAARLLGLVALGEDRDPHDLAGAVRQDDRAAHHLVGVAGVDAEADVRLDATGRT